MKNKLLRSSTMLAVFVGSVLVGAVSANAATIVDAYTALNWSTKQAAASTEASANAEVGARADIIIDGVKKQGTYTRTYGTYIDDFYAYSAIGGTHTWQSSGYHTVDKSSHTSISLEEVH